MTDLLEQGYGIMPNKILYDKELKRITKSVFVVISSLCAEKGYCRGSNNYIAKTIGVSEVTVSRAINELVSKGYISSQIDKNNGNKRCLTLSSKMIRPIIKNDKTYYQKGQDINIIDNILLYKGDSIKNKDDIREIMEVDYINNYADGLNCLMCLVGYGYQIEKTPKAVKEFINWLKEKASIYGYKTPTGEIAWKTLYQKFDSWLERHKEKGDKIEKYKSSVLQFIKPK